MRGVSASFRKGQITDMMRWQRRHLILCVLCVWIARRVSRSLTQQLTNSLDALLGEKGVKRVEGTALGFLATLGP